MVIKDAARELLLNQKFRWFAWCTMSVALMCMALGIILSFGIIQKKSLVTGPFNSESNSVISQALVVDLRSDGLLRKLISTGGDSSNSPQASTLRVFVNGLELTHPHSLHDLIRTEGAGRFSHWQNNLIFSLPKGVENSASTQLELQYPVYLEPKLLGVALSVVLVTGGLLLWQLYLREPLAYVNGVSNALLVLGYLFQGGLALTFLAAIIFLATTLVGWFSGYLLPNTAFFRWWPELNVLAMNEPFFGHVILFVAMVGAGAGWLATSLSQQSESFTVAEQRLVRTFRRFGFFFVAGLFFYSVGATWSGIPRPQDLGGNAIAGLLPFNDANGHFQYVYLQALKGEWEPFVARRPLAAAFRTVGVFGVDYNNFYFLILQVLALATATFFAARAVMDWRGIWAGLTFLGLTFILVRPYLPTNLTEPLGIFWALVSVPFLIRAIRFNRLSDVGSGFHLTIWALLTRMGAMFTVPALGLWAIVSRRGSFKNMAIAFLLISGIVVINIALVSGLSKVYGTSGGAVGSNFSHTICGLTHGTDWTGCGRIYAKELGSLTRESEQASLYYLKAKEKFLNEPRTFFARLLEGELYFAKGIWKRVLSGYVGSIPSLFPTLLWWLAAIGGFIWVMRSRRERFEGTFWLFFLVGLAASVPFVIFDDGWRVLCASFVILSILLASSFASPLHKPLERAESSLATVQKYRIGLLLLIAILCLIVPMLAHKYDRLDRLHFPQIKLGVDEELFLGTRRMSGFLVMPNGETLPKEVPAIHESDFIAIIRNSGIEQYEKLVTPQSVHKPPFAIVSAISINQRTHGLLILPLEVFSTLDERLWRFRFESSPGQFWVKVVEATPIGK